MRSNVFNMNRFRRYFSSDFRSAVSNYGITFLVFSTLAVTAYLLHGLFFLTATGEWHGMSSWLRIVLFVIFGLTELIGSPAKLYGHLTDRKEGSAFLLVPASRFEKFVSMVLISCIITPFLFGIVYMTLDSFVCFIDPACGDSLFKSFFKNSPSFIDTTPDILIYKESIRSILTPWLYFDDIIQISLLFLMGALIFKKSKTGKTLGSLILISISLNLLLTPIMSLTMFDKFKMMAEMSDADITLGTMEQMFPFFSWVLRNLAILDTISDTLMNGLLMFFVWLRLKKIKH